MITASTRAVNSGANASYQTLIVVKCRTRSWGATEDGVARSSAVISLLGVTDRSKVRIASSEQLATLHDLVSTQLGAFGNNLVLIVFGLMAFVVCATTWGLVLLRRKDFGRRRALGASRRLVIILVTGQAMILAIAGATLGSAAGVAVLAIVGAPAPNLVFFLATTVLAAFVQCLGTLPPAIAASMQDPVKELRVP
ncbi:ABC transporter permease [Microbacterium panaciterrae]|uniref:ABC transporter permease n=1 Tax=Microbacterium panaciterrae TaxID=985759 RepID=UPI003CD0BFD8